MKKKLIIFIMLVGILVPINVKALTGSVTLSCDKVKVKVGEETTCYIKGDISEGVSAVDATLELGDNLTLSSITKDSIWEGSIEDEDIKLYTDNNKSGKFNIASFKVKAGTNSGVDTSIKLNNVKLTNGTDFAETDFTVTPVSIRIPSTVNTLSSLRISNLAFIFSENVTTYSFEVDSDSATITATKKDSNSTVSGDIGTKSLKYGLNTFNIKVTSESGDTKTYTLKLTRPDKRSKDNYLLDFKFNGYDIDFNKDKTKYDLIVDNKVTRIASCYGKVNDDTILCIDSEKACFSEKSNNDILFNNKSIEELFKDDSFKYECNDDETLCDIYLNNEKIGIIEVDEDGTENGYILLGDLKVGSNELKMVITAENEEEQEYIFNINRKNEEGKEIVSDKTDEEITSNGKTGSTYIIVVSIIMIVALVVFLILAKKKGLFNKIKNN